MTASRKTVGSFGAWLWARSLEVVVCLATVDLVRTLIRSRGVTLFDLAFLFLLVYIILQTHPFAYGWADDSGVTFRQYLGLRFIPWQKVERVEWRPRGLALVELVLRDAPSWQRRLIFTLNPAVREALNHLLGRSVPEVVLWIRLKISSARSNGLEGTSQQG